MLGGMSVSVDVNGAYTAPSPVKFCTSCSKGSISISKKDYYNKKQPKNQPGSESAVTDITLTTILAMMNTMFHWMLMTKRPTMFSTQWFVPP
jgi:hypothetical protein